MAETNEDARALKVAKALHLFFAKALLDATEDILYRHDL